MKISIITVVFNNCNTILDAINSVYFQTYKNVEYIIIDGGSSDGTLDIINANMHKISKVISERDNGIYDAMNKGIKLATGDIIGILNSDDFYFDKLVLFDVIQEFAKNPDLDIIYGNIVYVNQNKPDVIERKWISENYYKKYFEDGNVPPHPALFLKKCVYKHVKHFDLDFRLASDYEFMLRVFKSDLFKIKYFNRMMVKMRLGGATNKNWKNIYKGNIEVIKSWKKNHLSVPYFFLFKRIYKRLIQFL
jgi:glycosyltransferase involved in cell wall biosynthesis